MRKKPVIHHMGIHAIVQVYNGDYVQHPCQRKSAVDWKISKTVVTYILKMIKKKKKKNQVSVVEFHQCSTVQTSSTELNS